MLNVVLFGPPGAGKGTQSKKIIEKFNLVHLSTGDILRHEIARNTELGAKAKALMDAGQLVPDETVIEMIRQAIEENRHSGGFIFDGYPRTVLQAEALDRMLTEKGLSISAMIALEVDEKELERRLLERGKESGRPDDANTDVIRHRIGEYISKTTPVAEFYKQQHKYFQVAGVGEINAIFGHIVHILDPH